MKTLTIKQPYPYLIGLGIKDIENRSWRTNFRGRIYLHASASKELENKDVSLYLSFDQWNSLETSVQYEISQGLWNRSAIIGEVDIIDCVQNHSSIWALEGYWHWVLANPVLYKEPIHNIKGKLSFWEFDPSSTQNTKTF